MDNPDKLATLDTHDTETKQNAQHRKLKKMSNADPT